MTTNFSFHFTWMWRPEGDAAVDLKWRLTLGACPQVTVNPLFNLYSALGASQLPITFQRGNKCWTLSLSAIQAATQTLEPSSFNLQMAVPHWFFEKLSVWCNTQGWILFLDMTG